MFLMSKDYRYRYRYIDYRCEDRINVGKLRGDIGAISYVLIPSFRKPDHHPKKKYRSARRYY